MRFDLTILPSFLLKKIYKKGSLRHIEEGIAFDLKNILAPGLITGINFVKINDTLYNSSVIQIIKSGAETLAEQISSENPLLVKFNEEITCVMKSGLKLQEGLNNIIVELTSYDVGKVQVNLSDTL
ncbi:MAG: hypothetical protein A2039_09550 [Candidatus Melainabacteria bacterium GWA2_34_9]|nr:MAG: hypothetical protein A2039_09550 [Candidatus Melainabacteria bacterium GWA2_34_9]